MNPSIDISICMAIDTEEGKTQYPHVNILRNHQIDLLDFLISNYLRHRTSARAYLAMCVSANGIRIFRVGDYIPAGKSIEEIDDIAGKLWLGILQANAELAKVTT